MASRNKRIKRRGNRRRRGDLHGLRTYYGPQAYQRQMQDSGLVFVPSVQLPPLTLSILQLMMRGGIQGNRSIDDAIGRHFSNEKATFGHLASFFQLFDFKRRKADVQIGLSVIVGFVLTLQAVFGTHGAFKMWNMIFDFVLSGAKVSYSTSEPVASLTLYSDADDFDEGWDVHFPAWPELTAQTMREFRRMDEVHTYQVHAAQGSEYHKDVARMLAQVTDGQAFTSRYNVGSIPRGGYALVQDPSRHVLADQGWAVRGMLDGILGDLIDSNRATINAATALQESQGGNAVPMGMALEQYAKGLLLQPPKTYPIVGGSLEQLDHLHPSQEFDVPRTATVGGRTVAYRHSGLDLPAQLGTRILAPFGGEVVRTFDEWNEAEHGNSPKYSRGNWARVHTAMPGGARLVTDYMHMHDVGVSTGDKISAGGPLGSVGSTGNSTGPHLHIEARYELPGAHGRPDQSFLLDPTILLEQGVVAAAKAAGAPVLPDAPVLGGALWALQTLTDPSSAMPVAYGGVLDVLGDWLRPAFDKADEWVTDIAEEVRDWVGPDDFDAARDAVVKTTSKVLDFAEGPGAPLVKSIFSLAGLGQYSDDAVRVLNRAWDAGERSNYGSSADMFEGAMRQLVEELKRSGVADDKISDVIGKIRASGLGALLS